MKQSRETIERYINQRYRQLGEVLNYMDGQTFDAEREEIRQLLDELLTTFNHDPEFKEGINKLNDEGYEFYEKVLTDLFFGLTDRTKAKFYFNNIFDNPIFNIPNYQILNVKGGNENSITDVQRDINTVNFFMALSKTKNRSEISYVVADWLSPHGQNMAADPAQIDNLKKVFNDFRIDIENQIHEIFIEGISMSGGSITPSVDFRIKQLRQTIEGINNLESLVNYYIKNNFQDVTFSQLLAYLVPLLISEVFELVIPILDKLVAKTNSVNIVVRINSELYNKEKAKMLVKEVYKNPISTQILTSQPYLVGQILNEILKVHTVRDILIEGFNRALKFIAEKISPDTLIIDLSDEQQAIIINYILQYNYSEGKN